MNKCDIPPEGWTCTRDKGHDGPCAAVPEGAVLVRYGGGKCGYCGDWVQPQANKDGDYVRLEAVEEHNENAKEDLTDIMNQLVQAESFFANDEAFKGQERLGVAISLLERFRKAHP